MKKQILGFGSISQFINNTPGQNSKVGELSTWSQTFSKTKGYYTDGVYPGYCVTTFSVVDTATGNDTTLTQTETNLFVKICKVVTEYAVTNPAPLDPTDFRNYIQAEFFNDIQNLTMGELVQGAGVQMPSWIDFQQKAGDKNLVRLWFADDNFANEYPDFDITVVPPHPDVTVFSGGWAAGVARLVEWPNSKLIEELQAKKNLNPETYIRMLEVDFVNRLNTTQKKTTTWYFLVYGEAGDTEDSLKDAAIDWLVKSSGKDEAYWEPVFPELFKRTEFALFPRWEKISIPNMSDLTALYSPFTDIKETETYLKAQCSFYPAAHITTNMFTFPVTYKSINVAGVNGVNNIDAQKRIDQVWKDYIAVGTSSPDFQRMEIDTQNWVHFMIKLITTAENATTTSTLPQGIRRVRRGNLVFVSGNYNRANYLVTLRSNYVTG